MHFKLPHFTLSCVEEPLAPPSIIQVLYHVVIVTLTVPKATSIPVATYIRHMW